MALAVKWQNKSYSIPLREDDMSLAELSVLIGEVTGSRSSVIKLLVPGRKAVHLGAEGSSNTRLKDAGLLPGTHALMLATSQEAVAQVQAAREQPRLPGFDHELKMAAARRGRGRELGAPLHSAPASGQWSFGDYQAWEVPSLSPRPQEALRLLHRLAADPGIIHVMRLHQWSVGLLSELPPEGKVGVSPVCILGLNVNQGQEIKLRLRTDDLKGFRKYESIRETLVHELAHMVYGDHDHKFKALNSELRRQVLGVGLSAGPAFQLGALAAAEEVLGTSHWGLMGDEGTAGWEGGQEQRVRTVGGPGQAHAPPPGVSARAAAAEAALRRSMAAAAAAAAGAAGAGAAGSSSSPPLPGVPGALGVDSTASTQEQEQWRQLEHEDEGTRRAEEAMRRLEQE